LPALNERRTHNSTNCGGFMQNLKSLVVEDNPIAQKIMRNILKEYGSCDLANNGWEGFVKFENSIKNNHNFDLICLDIEMPRLDGVTLLDKIRTLEKENKVKNKSIIIMVTSQGEKDVVKKCCRLGCNSFIVKPVDKYNLGKILKRHKISDN
jgi:two-component system chemotaxis response regulator CheY